MVAGGARLHVLLGLARSQRLVAELGFEHLRGDRKPRSGRGLGVTWFAVPTRETRTQVCALYVSQASVLTRNYPHQYWALLLTDTHTHIHTHTRAREPLTHAAFRSRPSTPIPLTQSTHLWRVVDVLGILEEAEHAAAVGGFPRRRLRLPRQRGP